MFLNGRWFAKIKIRNGKCHFTVTDNLLLNISGGLKVKDLSDRERELLKRKFGKNWKKIVFGK